MCLDFEALVGKVVELGGGDLALLLLSHGIGIGAP